MPRRQQRGRDGSVGRGPPIGAGRSTPLKHSAQAPISKAFSGSRALPVDELKLDRSFVSSLTTAERAAAIVRSTLQLSADLGMSMVVEGVEDAATLAALREWGCDIAQGYHIARPMPGDSVLGWLAGAGPSTAAASVPRPRSALSGRPS